MCAGPYTGAQEMSHGGRVLVWGDPRQWSDAGAVTVGTQYGALS